MNFSSKHSRLFDLEMKLFSTRLGDEWKEKSFNAVYLNDFFMKGAKKI